VTTDQAQITVHFAICTPGKIIELEKIAESSSILTSPHLAEKNGQSISCPSVNIRVHHEILMLLQIFKVRAQSRKQSVPMMVLSQIDIFQGHLTLTPKHIVDHFPI
jgi:hypothetical protein